MSFKEWAFCGECGEIISNWASFCSWECLHSWCEKYRRKNER